MTSQAKDELISKVVELLESSITIEGSEFKEFTEHTPIEMLTVKEQEREKFCYRPAR